MSCLFCNIVNGTTPSTKVYEDDRVFAFDDIDPKAPVHVLIVPREHFKDIDDLANRGSAVMADIFKAVDRVAELKGVRETGYRVIINNGKAGGQVIWHLHVHLLGGRESMGPMLAE